MFLSCLLVRSRRIPPNSPWSSLCASCPDRICPASTELGVLVVDKIGNEFLYKVTGEIAALDSFVVINGPKFKPDGHGGEPPQLDSLVLIWKDDRYRAEIDGENSAVLGSGLPDVCKLEDRKDSKLTHITDAGRVPLLQSLTNDAQQFVDIFESHPSLKYKSLIVYATSKHWSRM
eukprot:GHVT01057097.1.p1 GENE.GHVT01057097.1~~GHVT01057097.1.p1  ORF type:complete len:175 (+),score=2.63 GHVT01057097.1:192-716(+)